MVVLVFLQFSSVLAAGFGLDTRLCKKCWGFAVAHLHQFPLHYTLFPPHLYTNLELMCRAFVMKGFKYIFSLSSFWRIINMNWSRWYLRDINRANVSNAAKLDESGGRAARPSMDHSCQVGHDEFGSTERITSGHLLSSSVTDRRTLV